MDWSGEIQEAGKPDRIDAEACTKAWAGLRYTGEGRTEQVKELFLFALFRILSHEQNGRELEHWNSQRHFGKALGTLTGKI